MSEYPLGSAERPLRVAVVGSGPSGFYAVGALFKRKELHVSVDLFDRLPTPFGLVRGGVAPDHQKIKKVIRAYQKTAADPRFRFFGNVMLGRDVQLEDLMRHYDQVVLATGNESDRQMGLPGEDLEGVYSATEFVGWYNGHPDFADREFPLGRATRAAVVGNGNVAIDVVRVLAKRPDELAPTDIAGYAVDALASSTLEELVMWGRRGPAQAAFSPKEIKELGELDNADLVIGAEELDFGELTTTWLAESAGRDNRKNVDYLNEVAAREVGAKQRKVICRFLVSPKEFIGENGRLTGVRLERNALYPDDTGTPRPKGTGETWIEPVDIVFKAIGYRGVPIQGVPFYDRWGTFPNEAGRILTEHGGDEAVKNLYVVGWAKRGPSGLIGTNQGDSVATVNEMLADIEGVTAPVDPTKDADAVLGLLDERRVRYVSFADWQLLDAEELRLGEAKGKIREKFTQVEDMLTALDRLKSA